MFQPLFSRKYFVQIGRWPKSTKDNYTPIFWTFLVVPRNVHFGLSAPPILKHETQNLKNRVCDHNAHKTHF